MRSMDSMERDGKIMRGRARALSGMVASLLITTLAAATATAASFSSDGQGFDPATLPATLPTIVYDDDLAPYLLAGDPSFPSPLDVEVLGSGGSSLCILGGGISPGGGNVCQASTVGLDNTGPYSVLQSRTISKVNTSEIGPGEAFTFFIAMLDIGPGGYAADEVVFNLNPAAPAGLDTSAVEPGFVFDGSFAPVVRVEDVSFAVTDGVVYNYLGWTVREGDTVSFQIDVLTDAAGRAAPSFFVGAIPLVVPEPGTALLMGLGLVGLSLGGRKRD